MRSYVFDRLKRITWKSNSFGNFTNLKKLFPVLKMDFP